MASENGVALLALMRLPKVSWSKTTKLLDDGKSMFTILETNLTGDQPSFDTERLMGQHLAGARNEIASWALAGIHFVTIFDRDYPLQLHLIHQRPPFLTFRGHLLESDRNGIAVVGTRKASPKGVRQAHEIAKSLAMSGIPVISGLAMGIDTAAHGGALEAGGRTVAVIGTGINKYYPAENEALQREIASCGAVISQFLPDHNPTKASFPMRNAIMSGYSAATLVVEASETSGAKMQARIALEHGRSVILLSTLVQEHAWARDFATRPNVYVVSSTLEACMAAMEVSKPLRSDALVNIVA